MMPTFTKEDATQLAGLPPFPVHGFRGDATDVADGPPLPRALTLAISRETGSRGIVIAKLAAKRLGWTYYDQETLEYLAQEAHLVRTVLEELEPAEFAWVEERLTKLLRSEEISQQPSIVELARAVLALGVKGKAVILGRGAGRVLPAASTLYVRVVAPLEDRIKFLAQMERLTPEQAAEQAASREDQRTQFAHTHFRQSPNDPCQYDMLVNSSQLGEDLATQIVVAAARLKSDHWEWQCEVAENSSPEPA